MVKNIYQICIVFIFLLTFFSLGVNASIENIGTVKQNDCITLPQICNCSFSNITMVMYPNKSYVSINSAMTKDGTYFNYTFCNTSILGQYFVNGVGDKDGILTPFNFWFEVTSTGAGLTTAEGIIYFIGLALAMVFFGLSLYFSITIPFSNGRDNGKLVSINKLKYLKLIFIGTTYALLLLIVGIANGITRNLIGLNQISVIFNWIYWVLLSGLFPAIVIIFIGMIIFQVEDKILAKKLKRGGFFR
jgi:hypothetical protein